MGRKGDIWFECEWTGKTAYCQEGLEKNSESFCLEHNPRGWWGENQLLIFLRSY